jgi:hypothetical protein
MGFNKRYLDKDKIMDTINSNGSISRLVNADMLICDSWSTKFMDNYDFKKYQKLRDKLNNDVQFSSKLNNTYEHENFDEINKISNLSNVLENLINNPSWLEVIITLQILGNEEIDEYSRGKFDKLKNICINKIINYYTTESRDKIINNILI